MKIHFDTSSVAHIAIGFGGFYWFSVLLNVLGVDYVLADKISLGVLIFASLFKELNDRGLWIKWLLTSRSKSGFDIWDLFYSITPALIYLAFKYQ